MLPAVFDGGPRFADPAHAVDGLFSPDDGGAAGGKFLMQTGEEVGASDEEVFEGVEGEIANGGDEAGRLADVGNGFLFEQVGNCANVLDLQTADVRHEPGEVELVDLRRGAAGELGPHSRVSGSFADEEEDGQLIDVFGERSLGRHNVGVADFLWGVVDGDLKGDASVAADEIGGGGVCHLGVEVLEVQSEDEVEQADAGIFQDDGGRVEVLGGVELQILGERHE